MLVIMVSFDLGVKGNRRISPSEGISRKGTGVSRNVTVSNNGQVFSKSPLLSPSKTKTKIMISKSGHSHTKEPSPPLSNSKIRPSSAKESNINIAKKNRGTHREKVLLNGDSDSLSSRPHQQKRLSSSNHSPLPPLYHQSSSSPSSTPPPLPQKTLPNGLSKSSSAYSILHDECNSDPIYSLSNGRPKPSVSPYTRSRISKTSSDNSLSQMSKSGYQSNLKSARNLADIQIKSHRSSSLSRATSATSSHRSSTTSGIGLGSRDSFSNRSSSLITASLSSSNELKRDNSIAMSKRSNSSGLIDLKSTRRRSSITKPPPPPIMTRAAPSTRQLQRKISRNSLSSNSSVSSQTTEDTSATTGSSGISSGSNGMGITSTSSGVSSMSSSSSSRRRSVGLSSTNSSSTVNGSGFLDTDSSYLKWKVRKREEKRLKERRDYLECQLRRY